MLSVEESGLTLPTLLHARHIGRGKDDLLIFNRRSLRTIGTIVLLQLRTEVSLIFRPLSKPMQIQFRECDFRPHQDDQLGSII